jgi:hypothetical protein
MMTETDEPFLARIKHNAQTIIDQIDEYWRTKNYPEDSAPTQPVNIDVLTDACEDFLKQDDVDIEPHHGNFVIYLHRCLPPERFEELVRTLRRFNAKYDKFLDGWIITQGGG